MSFSGKGAAVGMIKVGQKRLFVVVSRDETVICKNVYSGP